MADYILRSIDTKLWRRVKVRADEDAMPVRQVIFALLRAYADGKVSVAPAVGYKETA